MSKRPRAFIFTTCVMTATACASSQPPTPVNSRQHRYLAAHRAISADVAAAIEAGHVSLGMDPDQVMAVLGDTVRTSVFARSRAEIWMYPASRFHQDGMRAHGASSCRLVFLTDRLSTIEPI